VVLAALAFRGERQADDDEPMMDITTHFSSETIEGMLREGGQAREFAINVLKFSRAYTPDEPDYATWKALMRLAGLGTADIITLRPKR